MLDAYELLRKACAIARQAKPLEAIDDELFKALQVLIYCAQGELMNGVFDNLVFTQDFGEDFAL